jgi:hypothetical protein
MSRNFSRPPDLCPASTPRLSRRNKNPLLCELSHSGAAIAERQLPVTSNSPPSEHEQGEAECQYPGTSKVSRFSEKSGGIRPRHASQVRAASPGRGYLGPRAAGPPSNARDNPVAWGPGWVPGPAGPRGRRHGRPVAVRPTVRVACAASVAPLVLAADRRAAQRQPACAAAPAVVARIEHQPRSR